MGIQSLNYILNIYDKYGEYIMYIMYMKDQYNNLIE